MKLTFRNDGSLWAILKDSHPDPEDGTTYQVTDSFNPVISETSTDEDTKVVYITEQQFLTQQDL